MLWAIVIDHSTLSTSTARSHLKAGSFEGVLPASVQSPSRRSLRLDSVHNKAASVDQTKDEVFELLLDLVSNPIRFEDMIAICGFRDIIRNSSVNPLRFDYRRGIAYQGYPIDQRLHKRLVHSCMTTSSNPSTQVQQA
jgi:hypothetical protein